MTYTTRQHKQFGMWMGIQGDTINGFGCGPKGPMDCSVGTTPGEHWARRPTMRKQAQKLKVNVAKGATLGASPSWNGLGAKTNPFAENPDEKVTADAFNSQGQVTDEHHPYSQMSHYRQFI
jgi:hypothetical protein